MDDDLISLLKNNKIFSSLNDEDCKQILPKFSKVELSHDEILFYQGDPADAVYLVQSGKLCAILTNKNTDKIVGHIDPGETVGESGALTNEPRSLTIKALTDLVLYRLSSSDFIEICHLHPQVMFAAIQPVMTRSRSLIKVLSAEKNNKHIAVIPANKTCNLNAFFEKLIGFADKHSNILIISDLNPDFHKKDLDLSQLRQTIINLEKQQRPHKIIYLLTSPVSPLARVCLKRAEMIYIAANYNSTPKIDHVILDRIHSPKSRTKLEPALILIYPENASKPRQTAAWLNLTAFSLHHHVRMTAAKDFQRLLRFMRDRAVGIILGGGGTRGWAHIGVLKAIREAKIPIDLIGGTSVGAMIGAAYAIHESVEDAYERFHKIVFDAENSVSWTSLTWPAISLFSAKTFTKAQQEVYEDLDIEDLRIPFFCVSCNLATNTEVVHRRGRLWQCIRASSAIPGIIPPMVIDNELHLDGGLLNNLPVDIGRILLGSRSRIISVEINSFAPDKHKYSFPPSLSFWQVILAKLGIRYHEYRFPRFVDTFMRSVFIGSFAKAKQNSLAANLAINLNLSKFRLLHSSQKQADRMIEIGYETAIKEIEKVKTQP